VSFFDLAAAPNMVAQKERLDLVAVVVEVERIDLGRDMQRSAGSTSDPDGECGAFLWM